MLKWKIDVWQALVDKGYGFVNLKGTPGLSQYTLVRLHRGECSMSFKALASLCRLLECQPGDILEYKEEE